MTRSSVTLLVPGLAEPPRDVGDFPATPALDRLFARARATPDPETGFERALVQGFFETAQAPWAALSSWGDTGAPPRGAVLRVEPLHLQAGTHHHVHFDQARLDLDAQESAAIVNRLNAFLEAEGITLKAPSPGRWYLHLPAAPAMTTQPLHHGLTPGTSLWMPTGPDAAEFKRLVTELQMLLHDHPVNVARERLGQLPVNSLWLWGEGTLPPDGRAPFDLIVGAEAIGRGLAQASGAAWYANGSTLGQSIPILPQRVLWVVDALLRPALWNEPEDWVRALVRFERDLATLTRTCFHHANITLRPLAGHAYHARPGSFWRSWRRARPFIRRLGPSQP